VDRRTIRFGIIGGGLMGREFASACARWCHLRDLGVRPQVVAACSRSQSSLDWFRENVPSLKLATNDYRELLSNGEIDAVYCALPHHLHAEVNVDAIAARKNLLGEKPFGIDLEANARIVAAAQAHPEVLVRCSSEFPFFPGAYQITRFLREGRFGRIIEVESGLWHSSDLDPRKPINWKRQLEFNGEYGCLGDLGMHVLHIPLRFGWLPRNVRALLSKIVTHRPDRDGSLVPCDTWDNGILACEVNTGDQCFPMLLSTKRIAPGEANTWFIRILGTDFSAEYSTKYPKTLRTLTFRPGMPQSWEVRDLGYESAYPTVTGAIFEFGFPDAMLQMVAAFCDELAHGHDRMHQPFRCVTPEESSQHHRVLTAALESGRTGQTVPIT